LQNMSFSSLQSLVNWAWSISAGELNIDRGAPDEAFG
jgi:hypothetical protein